MSLYDDLRERGRLTLFWHEANLIPAARAAAKQDGLQVVVGRPPLKGLSSDQANRRPYSVCLVRPEDPTTIYRPGPKTAATVDNDYSDSVMICLKPDEDLRKKFVAMEECTEEIEELHLTLFYLGSTEDCGGPMGRERLYRACYAHAISGASALVGHVNGFGVFMNPDSDVLVALWDLPYIAEFRATLGDRCREHGVAMRTEDHGFTPHMTLTYVEGEKIRNLPEVPSGAGAEQRFVSFWLVWGEEWTQIPLISAVADTGS